MDAKNKAHLLAAQLLATRKEDADIKRIEHGLELVHRTKHLEKALIECVVGIGIDKGCMEEYEMAKDIARIVSDVLGLDTMRLIASMDDAINRAYMGEAA